MHNTEPKYIAEPETSEDTNATLSDIMTQSTSTTFGRVLPGTSTSSSSPQMSQQMPPVPAAASSRSTTPRNQRHEAIQRRPLSREKKAGEDTSLRKDHSDNDPTRLPKRYDSLTSDSFLPKRADPAAEVQRTGSSRKAKRLELLLGLQNRSVPIANIGDRLKDFAGYLGLDIEKDKEWLWLVEEAWMSPVPKPWLELSTEEGFVYYWNEETEQSSWNHPLDRIYRAYFLSMRLQRDSSDKSTVFQM